MAPGAGGGQGGRQARRHLGVRRRALRDADRPAGCSRPTRCPRRWPACCDGEIDLDALPPTTPPAIRRLLRRCLERNPKNRLRDIGDARIALGAAARAEDGRDRPRPKRPGTPVSPMRFSRGCSPPAHDGGRRSPDGEAGRAPGPAPLRPVRPSWRCTSPGLSVPLTDRGVGRSPAARHGADGSRLAFEVDGPVGEAPLPAGSKPGASPSRGHRRRGRPFLSPDSRWIGYFSPGNLRKVSIEAGPIDLARSSLTAAPSGAPRLDRLHANATSSGL